VIICGEFPTTNTARKILRATADANADSNTCTYFHAKTSSDASASSQSAVTALKHHGDAIGISNRF